MISIAMSPSPLTIRLKPELRAKLEADAEAGYRSLTMQLIMIIEQYYASRDS